MNNTTHTFKCKQLVVATIAITIIILFQSCSAEKYMKRGERYLAIGEYYEAAAEFKTAYNKTPPKDKALRGERAQRLALCYERINSTQKAIAACRNAIRYGKGTPEIHLTLAQQLMKNGSYNEAEKETAIRIYCNKRKKARFFIYCEKDGCLQLPQSRILPGTCR